MADTPARASRAPAAPARTDTPQAAARAPRRADVVQRLAGPGLLPGDVQLLRGVLGNQALAEMTGGALTDDQTRGVAHAGVEGAGHPLPFLEKLQATFGEHDLTGVRAHTDPTAASAARLIGARAYATGDHVAFATPTPDLSTVAHEVAHVVDQRRGLRLPGGVGREGDPHERRADAVAARAAAGRSAGDLLPAASPSRAGGGAPVQMDKESHVATLFAAGEMEMEIFNEAVHRWARDTGGEGRVRPGMKDMPRALDKIASKEAAYTRSGAHGTAAARTRVAVSAQTDILAGTIMYDSIKDMQRGLRKLKDTTLPGEGAAIVRFKNRMRMKFIRDFLLNIRMPSGYVVELQIHLRPIIAAKMEVKSAVEADTSSAGGYRTYDTHDAYDYARIFETFDTLPRMLARATMSKEDRHEAVKARAAHAMTATAAGLADAKRLAAVITLDKEVPAFLEKFQSVYKLYNDIMSEIMEKTWERVFSEATTDRGRRSELAGDVERAAFMKVKGLPAVDYEEATPTDDLQDLRSIRTFWEGQDEATVARFAGLRRRYKGVMRRTIADAPAAADTTTALGMLDVFYHMLKEKHEKKKDHAHFTGLERWEMLTSEIESLLRKAERILEALAVEAGAP